MKYYFYGGNLLHTERDHILLRYGVKNCAMMSNMEHGTAASVAAINFDSGKSLSLRLINDDRNES